MIDFHTHILPRMDDGSRDITESKAMLDALCEQGISGVCLTSHFYASQNPPELFLKRRGASAQLLFDAYGGRAKLPVEVHLGAEVLYYTGISANTESILPLCMEGSRLLLLEMPFHEWSEGMIREVMALQGKDGLQVMLAHVDRYFGYVDDDIFDAFRSRGILLSLNCDALLRFKTKRRALKMIRRWQVSALTSDCHDPKERRPRFDEAFKVLGRKKLYDQMEMLSSGVL